MAGLGRVPDWRVQVRALVICVSTSTSTSTWSFHEYGYEYWLMSTSTSTSTRTSTSTGLWSTFYMGSGIAFFSLWKRNAHSWLSGVAVACQRCRASDPGSLPGLASGRQVQFIDALHQNQKPREIFIEWAICLCGWKYFFSLCAIM